MAQDQVMNKDNKSASSKDEPTPDHYAHYDLIMSIDDQKQPTQISNFTKIAFFTGCVAFSIFSGVGLSAIGGRTMYRDEMDDIAEERNRKGNHRNGKKVVVHEDPLLFATRALGWGTLIGVLGSGAVGLAIYGLFLKERIRTPPNSSTSE